jgi:hypothetical protein
MLALAWHLVRLGAIRNTYETVRENLKETDIFQDLGLYGMIKLK